MAEPMMPKTRKKWLRSKAKLKKELEFSELPSSYLVIGNAGLANGMRRADLETLVAPYQTLIMPPQKSYALLMTKNAESAQALVTKLQGHVVESKTNLASPSTTLYLHYLKRIPLDHPNTHYTMVTDKQHPPGLHLLEDFITPDEETKLLDFLRLESQKDASKNILGNQLKHRQVWHYGYQFRYGYNDVDIYKPLLEGIPPILWMIISKLMETGHIQHKPNQITINKYNPGQGIPPHVDNPEAFDDGLASLSLGSQTVMDFEKQATGDRTHILLKPRSLMIFTGESRYGWTHGICPRKVDLLPSDTASGRFDDLTPVNRGTRVSVTFRKVREGYKGPNEILGMADPSGVALTDNVAAENLEKLHVHQVYDEIATHFTSTREKPWPKVKQFIASLEPYSAILDVGCGSGRYLGVRKDVTMMGCDRSENLIGICKEKGFEVFTCDGLSLSIRPGIFDACICIAVIHHYSTNERRKNAIEQLLAAVRHGGKVLISVWALEQEYKRIKSKYLKKCDQPGSDSSSATTNQNQDSLHISNTTYPTGHKEACLTSLPVHKNRTPFQQQDVLVPWHRKPPPKKKNAINSEANLAKTKDYESVSKKSTGIDDSDCKTFHRYYHVFKKGELEEICRTIPDVNVTDSYYDEGNWCVILEKLS